MVEPSAPFRIRPALGGDLPGVTALQAACFADAWGEASIAKFLTDPHGLSLLAVAGGGRPAGFALCRMVGGECEILSLGVAAEWRGRGLGARLLEAIAAAAGARGAERIYLEVAVQNTEAGALYHRHGFRQVGQRPGYYPRRDAPPGDARLLCRTL
ncbi:MAG: ribosomal protein S18-alanine N-acetyltransferase [Alphaproteobacteria bacterium]|nr:ribosomal protein S18-alanine N-acetyltransferase [Alphaproteobacteria bacterium]